MAAATEEAEAGAVPAPKELPPPIGLPPGWKCLLHVYRSGTWQGRTYQRFMSPSGQGGYSSIRACVRAHAESLGEDPDAAVAEYQRVRETKTAERDKVKEQESLRQELAAEAFRAKFGPLDGATLAALPGWHMETHYLESCGQTSRKFVDPEGRMWRLIKEVEAHLGTRLLENNGVEDLAATIELGKANAAAAGAARPRGEPERTGSEAEERAKFLRAMGKRPLEPPAPEPPPEAAPAGPTAEARAAPPGEEAPAGPRPEEGGGADQAAKAAAAEAAAAAAMEEVQKLHARIAALERDLAAAAGAKEKQSQEAPAAAQPGAEPEAGKRRRREAREAASPPQPEPPPPAREAEEQPVAQPSQRRRCRRKRVIEEGEEELPQASGKVYGARKRAREEEQEEEEKEEEEEDASKQFASKEEAVKRRAEEAEPRAEEEEAKARQAADRAAASDVGKGDKAEEEAGRRAEKQPKSKAEDDKLERETRQGCDPTRGADAETAKGAVTDETGPPRQQDNSMCTASEGSGRKGQERGTLKTMLEIAARKAKGEQERAASKLAEAGAQQKANEAGKAEEAEVCEEVEHVGSRRAVRRSAAGQPRQESPPGTSRGEEEEEEEGPLPPAAALTPRRRAVPGGDDAGLDASAAPHVPSSAQKRPRRPAGRAEPGDKAPPPPPPPHSAATFMDRWTKASTQPPEEPAAPPEAPAPVAPPAPAAPPAPPAEAPAAPASSTFMDRWAKASAAWAAASAAPAPAPPEAAAPPAGGTFMDRWASKAAAAAAAAEAKEEAVKLDIDIGSEAEGPASEDEASPPQRPGEGEPVPETRSIFRRPPPRGSTRRLCARELPELGLLPSADVRLPERVTWVAGRRAFLALAAGPGRWTPFSADVLGPRAALARALLHAGHGHLLRESPWSTACGGQSWSDRYGPRLVSDLKPERPWAQLRAWLQRWGRPGSPAAALVAGQPGCGKSCGARLLGCLAERKVLEYSLDDPEGHKFLDNLLKRQRTARDVTEGKDTLVVLDVPDDPPPALKDKLAPAVRASPHPVILTCGGQTVESLDSLRKLCLRLEVSPKPAHVARALAELAQREKLGPLPESFEAIAAACSGSWRGAVARLQLLSVASSSGPVAALPLPALSLPAACGRVLGAAGGGRAPSIEEVCELLAMDNSLPGLVQENHLETVERGLEEQRALEGCAAASEALALADGAAAAAEASAWGGVDEGLLAVEGLLLAAVHAVPRGCGGELRTARAERPTAEEPLANPALAGRVAAQLGVPKAYVRGQLSSWLLQRRRKGLPCSPGRFRLWLARRISSSFRSGACRCESGALEGPEVPAVGQGEEEMELEEQGGEEEEGVAREAAEELTAEDQGDV